MAKFFLLVVSLLYSAISGFAFSLSIHSNIATTLRTLNVRPMLLSMSSEPEQKGIVTMYKKETCPYCKKARALLEGKFNLSIKYVDIEEVEMRDEKLLQMRNFSGGRNTVPQVFFNSKHLGGNDDLEKLDASGQLQKEVDIVRSTPVTMMMDHWFHPWY
jgi:glutaredoxin 3